MNFIQFKSAVFSSVPENDPYRESKELQLRNWCYSFYKLLTDHDSQTLPFILDVLSEEDCWENTDSIHRIKLNRRKVAKKIIQLHSCKGKINTLDISERFKIASWCCLGEDIIALFDLYKRRYQIRYDSAGLKWLVEKLEKDAWSDPLTAYWLYVVGCCSSKLPLKDKHLYEYGLYLQLNGRHNQGHHIGYVEGVEFFWNRIKLLPEDKLNAHQKREIFMNAAVRAARNEFANNPEIFEFCFSQISPGYYLELLKRVSAEVCCTSIFYLLRYMCRFDYLQNLFDSLGPRVIDEISYRNWLVDLIVIQYSDNYANEAMNLFMHVWRKEGFDKHRTFVLKNEMEDSGQQGILLSLLVKRNYMEPIWAMLGESSSDQLKEFLDSKHAEYIYNVLRNRPDYSSLIRFFVPIA